MVEPAANSCPAGRTQGGVVAVSRGCRAVLCNSVRGDRHVDRIAERHREAQIGPLGCRRRVDADHRTVVVGQRQRGIRLAESCLSAVAEVAERQADGLVQFDNRIAEQFNRYGLAGIADAKVDRNRTDLKIGAGSSGSSGQHHIHGSSEAGVFRACDSDDVCCVGRVAFGRAEGCCREVVFRHDRQELEVDNRIQFALA